ncbi:hypothetical protein GDO81_019890 [Engystomops pustulosus]|uniref:Uncharacterized protein n=1 Tax=Engystomops pustulosus TaxID=76066 RepID=A0AAV6YW61_ENGPU|nr:hypothetical protein GDO81_019890 [Engystomops pustulosus]
MVLNRSCSESHLKKSYFVLSLLHKRGQTLCQYYIEFSASPPYPGGATSSFLASKICKSLYNLFFSLYIYIYLYIYILYIND